MAKLLKYVLQELRDTNYLLGNCVINNDKIRCEVSLMNNGMKLRDQIYNQWLTMSSTWSTKREDVKKYDQNILGNGVETSFFQRDELRKCYKNIYEENSVSLSNSIAIKSVYYNDTSFSSGDICSSSKTKTLLITDYFVSAENELSKYNNLQRERKIWWMRLSANPSRYSLEPYGFSVRDVRDKLLNECKSVTIKANFPYGSIDMEHISLVPLHKMDILSLPPSGDSHMVSLIRSVINLDLTSTAIILDASACRTERKNHNLLLNRILAPYQVLLANFHQGNKAIDELTLHLQYVITKSGLRLYEKFVSSNSQTEFEEKLMLFDSLGIPYSLLIDEESLKNGLIKMRNRDTTLFETIHISDIPNYLLNIFNNY